MDFQRLFRQFEENIKLNRHEENKELVERGQIVLNHLREKIAVPHTFQFSWQGSYAIGTGVRPINGEYDIDVCVKFNVRSADHTPVTVKGWVYDALKTLKPANPLAVELAWRGPCITAYYRQGKELKYHVDLVIMAQGQNGHGVCLARGKANAAPPDQSWEPDDRLAFIASIEQDLKGTPGEQFRRLVRYLKRWKDVHFPKDGVSAPSGFALTVAAADWFRTARPNELQNDLSALLALAEAIRRRFSPRYDARTRREMHRLTLKFPYAPYDDVLHKMSDEQHQQFYQRLEQLAQRLEESRNTGKTEPLRLAFGNDFPER